MNSVSQYVTLPAIDMQVVTVKVLIDVPQYKIKTISFVILFSSYMGYLLDKWTTIHVNISKWAKPTQVNSDRLDQTLQNMFKKVIICNTCRTSDCACYGSGFKQSLLRSSIFHNNCQ